MGSISLNVIEVIGTNFDEFFNLSIPNIIYTLFILGYIVWMWLYYIMINNEIEECIYKIERGEVVMPPYDLVVLEIDDEVYFINHMLLMITLFVSFVFGGYLWIVMALLTFFCIQVQNKRRRLTIGW